MNKNLFIVITAQKDEESRKRLTKYYNSRGYKIQFADQVEFEHTDKPSLTYARQLCPVGLIMYANIFGVELDKRRMFSTNVSIFENAVVSSELKPDESKIPKNIQQEPENENVDLDFGTEDENKGDEDHEDEKDEKEDDKEPEDKIPEDRRCPYCNAVARTDASYLKNHGVNCSRYIQTK